MDARVTTLACVCWAVSQIFCSWLLAAINAPSTTLLAEGKKKKLKPKERRALRQATKNAGGARKKAGASDDHDATDGNDGQASWDPGQDSTGAGQWGIIDLG